MQGIDLAVVEAENGVGGPPAAEVQKLQTAELVPDETGPAVCQDVHRRQFRVFAGVGQAERPCSGVQNAHAAVVRSCEQACVRAVTPRPPAGPMEIPRVPTRTVLQERPKTRAS